MIPAMAFGNPTRVTGTGVTTITTGNAAVVGVLCCNSATQGQFQLFGGTGATGATGGKALSGIITMASGSISSFIQVPCYGSGGLHINVVAGVANPDLTIYWNPA